MVERHRLQRRRIMRKFTITELSACDRPAQEHARAVIMKRADDEQEQENQMDTFQKIIERPRSFATFQEAAEHLKKMERAARANPEAYTKYVDGGRVEPSAVRRVPVVDAAVVRFDQAVNDIMARDGVSKLVAMECARVEHPDLFREYQIAGMTPSDLGLRPPGAVAT